MTYYLLLSLVFYSVHFIIKKSLNQKRQQDIDYPTDFHFNLPLITGNGIGFTFFGDYGYDMLSERAYYFFSIFFLPIIPLGCFRISREKYKVSNHKKNIQKYKIFCKDKWSLLEVIDIYAFAFSILLFIISVLSMF